MNGIFIIAHAPLAAALRQCVLHVFPDSAVGVVSLDVQANMPPEETLVQARTMLEQLGTPDTLVLVDVFGATPCNVAQKLVDGVHTKLITGVNLPMLLRTVSPARAGRCVGGARFGRCHARRDAGRYHRTAESDKK